MSFNHWNEVSARYVLSCILEINARPIFKNDLTNTNKPKKWTTEICCKVIHPHVFEIFKIFESQSAKLQYN